MPLSLVFLHKYNPGPTSEFYTSKTNGMFVSFFHYKTIPNSRSSFRATKDQYWGINNIEVFC